MRTILQKIPVIMFLSCLASTIYAGGVSLRLNVGTNEHRVTFTVVAENNTAQTISLMRHISDRTNWVSSSILWRVNNAPVEWLPKRAFLMCPPFDTGTLPPHSTNAVVLVEDDELFILTTTTNTHTRVGRPALPTSGEYRIDVVAVGDWGGHTGITASATINLEKSPTNKSSLSPGIPAQTDL